MIFSNTTIPLSTTIPEAMAMAINDTRFIVYPPKYSKMNEIVSEKGMVRVIIMAVLNRLKNTMVTTTMKNNPQPNV
jgi:hypothetical protein